MNTEKKPLSIPKDGLGGLKENFAADAAAGFVVFLLALPLSLGIAQASGFPPIMGLVSAILGGLVASLFAGSILTIKGPAAGLIVIVAGSVSEFGGGVEGWRLTLGVMVVAGLLQILFGVLKFGKFVDFFPLSAVHGMLAAIGLIIIAKQIPVLLNVNPAMMAGKGPLALFAEIPHFFQNLDPQVAVIGGISLAIMLGWAKVKHYMLRQIPAPVLVLLFAIPAGAVNARVFSFMANHPKVRLVLETRGLHIPLTTQFIGTMHDTASDEIRYYDEHILSTENEQKHKENIKTFENALDLNAKERARRFASINIDRDIKQIRADIKKRSVSYFEPRPELGHGTNALCYIGSREKMKGLFLDRRAFLQSYDYKNDPDGQILLQVLSPLPGVCGGINLEYYFSRMDIEKMGAGTKLPHNVMGLIGVANSSDGDLRPGLPLQMVENHDPVRLLMMIEHRPDVVLKVIQSSPAIYDWFDKGWLHLVAVSPENGNLYHFKNGEFSLYQPLTKVKKTTNINKVIETAKEMSSNHILDATKENIPVHVY